LNGNNSGMGRLSKTASFHRRIKNANLLPKKIPFPRSKPEGGLAQRYHDPCVVEIRNKHTKELVDIEVRRRCKIRLYGHITQVLLNARLTLTLTY